MAYEPRTGRSKFTEERRQKILEGFALGASPPTVAALARVSHVTLMRWIRRGEEAPEDSMWHKFYMDVQEARALPRERALKVVHAAMPDYPMLAWRYLERTEPGMAPPVAGGPTQIGPVTIQLSFSDGEPLSRGTDIEVIDGEVVNEQFAPAEPTALPTR